jgi:hypothetical protein
VLVNRDRIFGGDDNVEKKAVVVTDHAQPPAPAPTPSANDPAAELAAQAMQMADAGKQQAAIDSLLKARRVYPDSALLARTLGTLYFSKMWWNDGLTNLRDALQLDPALKTDPELIQMAIRGYSTTVSPDPRLARFVLDFDGATMKPALEEAANKSKNPDVKSRLLAISRRIR